MRLIAKNIVIFAIAITLFIPSNAFALVTEIAALDAELDDSKGGTFTVLNRAFDVATFTVDGTSYAIVASIDDSGVQIINLSDPTAITVADAATDGSADGFGGTFTELVGAAGVATFTVDSTLYAIVAGFSGNSVQIINLSDPTAITAEDAATDGSADGFGGTFTTLAAATGVATFTVSGNPYAIVASQNNNGVQIINLSDPTAITAEDAATQNSADGFGGTFTELARAFDVATFTVDSIPYAIVASLTSSGVQIINLSDPTAITVADAASTGNEGFNLFGAFNVAIFTVSSVPYAIVANNNGDGVQIINLSDPTAITAEDAATDGSIDGFGGTFTELNGAVGVETFVSDDTYAIVTASVDNGIQIINLSDPANIKAVDAETDGNNSFTALDGANDVAIFTVDSTLYAIVVSGDDDGVQIINLEATPPTLTITTNPTTPSSTKTSLVYTFQFSEDVTGFTSADITLNFVGAGAGSVDGSNFATTDANTYTLTLAGQDLTDLGNLSLGETVVASVDMTGLTSISSTDGVGAEQNTWTYNTGPSTPSSLSVNQGNTQISLTWTASTSGIGPITDYIVEYKQSSSDTWLTFNDGVSTSTSSIVTGLANDVSYDFRVSAESSGVFGSASSTATITPAVTATKATQSFINSANISFDDVTVTATDSGSITIEKLNSNPETSSPSETIVGSFFDITSSGTISDRTVIFSYNDVDVTGVDESSLTIYRFSGGTWSVLITIVDTDANTATATTPGFSSFVLGASSSSSSKSGDDVKPSYSITFDEDEYPISIGSTEFKFKDLGFNNPITIIETGKPISVNLLVYDNEGTSYIDKVELYTNLNGLFRAVDQSDTSIIYQKGNPLEILDPNGFFSDVTFSATEVNQKLQITYKITFAKEMEPSDIIVQTRDVSNNVAVLTVSDAWQIIKDPTTVEKTEPIIVELADVSLPINLKVRELTVEKPSYSINEEILFSGTVVDDRFDSIVSIIIRDPSNGLLTTIHTFHDKDGYFEASLDTDSKFKTDGIYTVTAFTDELNKSMQTTFYFSRDGSSESMMFGGKMKVEQLREDKIEVGATSEWTSIPRLVVDDTDDLHIWYEISGQVVSWVSPQKLDFGIVSDEKVFPELPWSITVPKNTPSGFYTFEWVEQCATMTGISCVSQDLQFRIQVVPSTSISDPLSGTITFLIGIVIAIGIFAGSFFILGKKVSATQSSKQ